MNMTRTELKKIIGETISEMKKEVSSKNPRVINKPTEPKPAIKSPTPDAANMKITSNDVKDSSKKHKDSLNRGDKKGAEFFDKIQKIVKKRVGHKV